MGEGDKSKRKNIFLIVLVVIILVALWLLIPNIPGLLEPEEENKLIYQQYEVFETVNVTTYRNDKLNVTLTSEYNPRGNFTGYVAEWVNILGNFSSAKGRSPENLHDEILRSAESLTGDQIRWYEYIIENVVK